MFMKAMMRGMFSPSQYPYPMISMCRNNDNDFINIEEILYRFIGNINSEDFNDIDVLISKEEIINYINNNFDNNINILMSVLVKADSDKKDVKINYPNTDNMLYFDYHRSEEYSLFVKK